MYPRRKRSLVARIALLCSIAVVTFTGESFGGFVPEHRIVRGEAIEIADAAHTVQIRDTFGKWVCGGSLIFPQFVVTAAHCMHSRFPTELQVVAGTAKLEGYGEEAQIAMVSKIYVHPAYKFSLNPLEISVDKDVAVLKLATPYIPTTTIKPIKLCPIAFQPGQLAQVVGWGHTEYNGPYADVLQSIDVPVISRKECLEMYSDTSTAITKNMICAGKPGLQDACQGDSGGPAIRNNTLCGIVSWGVGCADKTHVGIYTSIPAVRKFIMKSVRGKIRATV